MLHTIVRIALICIGIGAGVGILAIYDYDLTALLSAIFDGFTWIIDSIANAISGNDAARQVLTTRPR